MTPRLLQNPQAGQHPMPGGCSSDPACRPQACPATQGPSAPLCGTHPPGRTQVGPQPDLHMPLKGRELWPCHLSTVPALTHGSPAELPSAPAKVGGGKSSSLTHSPATPPGPTDHSPPSPLPSGRPEPGCPLLGLPPAALSGARLAGRQRLAARVGGHLRRGRGAGRGDSQSPRTSEGRWWGGRTYPHAPS